MFTTLANRLLLVVALLGMLTLLPERGNGQDKEFTPEERKQLETQAKELRKEFFVKYQQRKYGDAVRLMEQSLALLEKLYPKQDHAELAGSLNALGVTLSSLGQLAKALPYFERALAMRERLYPSQDHPNLANSLNNLGITWGTLGQPAKALPHFKRALAMRERLYPKQDHLDLAHSLTNLGNALNDLGQPAKALPHLERALTMWERLYPKQDHPSLAHSLNNLGIALNALGQPAKALPHLERALAMNERLYPKQDHPHLANSLNSLGTALFDLNDSAKALPHYERALAMNERLYPKQDHPDLALSLNNLGAALNNLGRPAKALFHLERALAMRERLYPKQDHPDLAHSLNNLGNALKTLGRPAKALPHYERALAMRERLYPKQDHPYLAHSLNNLGNALNALGQPAKALPHYERALAMNERLYPKQDHSHLANSLSGLGTALFDLNQSAKALPHYERALAMCERLYPKQDNRDLALSLNNLGNALNALGQRAKALPHYERALAMWERLYPKQDHPHLATSLHNMGNTWSDVGQPAKALPYYERALAMNERLYPNRDDPALATSLNNLGSALDALGQPAKALPYLERALAIWQNIAELSYVTESQALACVSERHMTQRVYLSASRDQPPENVYLHLWNSKAVITRILQDRHAAVRIGLDKNPEHKATWDELVRLRGQRTFWILYSGEDRAERDRQVRQLTELIEKVEGQLGKAFPEGAHRKALAKLGPKDLAKRLPDRSVFIDLFHYTHYEKGKPNQPRYVAFVILNTGTICRVELEEPAASIDLAVTLWRQAVSGWTSKLQPEIQRELEAKVEQQAKELRRLVWEPIAKHLPKDTQTVYLSLDGSLARFPFAALPGSKPGTILLQELALANVPHGPALLERLVHPPQYAKGPGNALVVGGVQYDPTGKAKTPWPYLKASDHERAALKHLAGKRPVLTLSGREATTTRVQQELPKVRYAHLATHGFFKEEELLQERKRVEQQLKAYEFSSARTTYLTFQGGQSPLVFTGLVLAGANAPDKDSKNSGLLVGDTIGDLPLEGMRLAVLSACETGLGDQAHKEGVSNLQLAFHVAGCADVVASLWQVNDRATAVFMEKFYHELWVKERPPLEALRQAQLLVYLRPDWVIERSGDFRNADPGRGPPKLISEKRRLEILEQGVHAPLAKGLQGKLPTRTPTKLWAAFVLSGTGQ